MSKLTLQFKGRTLKVFPVIEGDMIIGSSRDCTVFIDSLAIEERHAKISTNAQLSTVIDCESEAGTYLNQNKIDSQPLTDGDMIRVGKHTLLYNYQELREDELLHESSTNLPAIEVNDLTEEIESPVDRAAWVQILSGQNLGQTLQLNRPVTNLGKPGVAMVVIARRDDGYFISHLEGKVLPKVGDKEIGTQSYKLSEGDLILIGNIKMQFYLE